MTNKKKISEKQGQEFSRREFIGSAATASATFTVLSGRRSAAAPSNRINVAFIGVGNRGTSNIGRELPLEDVQIVALCDVHGEHHRRGSDEIVGLDPGQRLVESHYADEAKSGSYNGCATYTDFREMLDKESGIDAVVISTPDHVHAAASMAAINRGKHVFCEKPLAHSVYECRLVTEAARKAGVATQMGNQGHSGEGIRMTVEWIRAGAIGAVREVHAWSSAGGLSWLDSPDRPEERPPVPDNLDWDLWLGPSPERPYHSAYTPYRWRGWWDFGTAGIGDMGCHNIDPAFWALDLGAPTSVEASCTRLHKESFRQGVSTNMNSRPGGRCHR